MSRSQLIEWACVAAALFLYVLLKYRYLGHTIGDQNLWYYGAGLWTQGIMPYRDFFLSHPPFHILPAVMLILLGGSNLMALYALPSFFGILTGVLLYRMMRRSFGITGALFALTLFLFSYIHLTHSSHFTGVNVALFLFLLSIEFHLCKKFVLAGIALGLGVGSGIYILAGALALMGVSFWEERKKESLSFILSFGITIATVNLVFFLIAGKNFLNQVYLYHLAKTGQLDFFAGKGAVLAQVLGTNLLLFLLIVCAIPFFFWRLRRWQLGIGEDSVKALQLTRLAVFILVAYAVFFLLLKSLFTHYFLLIAPFVVITVTFLVTSILQMLSPPENSDWKYVFVAPFIVGLILISIITTSLNDYADNRKRKQFTRVEEIATYIETTLEEDETIYGDFGVAPLLSILSHRRIAGNEAESSILRFESGGESIEDFLETLEADTLRMVIVRPHRGISIYPPFRKYLLQNYIPVRRFGDEADSDYIEAWTRKD
jgi:hypothetical protein